MKNFAIAVMKAHGYGAENGQPSSHIAPKQGAILLWNESAPGMRIVKKVCGALVLVGGLYLIYTAH